MLAFVKRHKKIIAITITAAATAYGLPIPAGIVDVVLQAL
jgi:hypothetical protein